MADEKKFAFEATREEIDREIAGEHRAIDPSLVANTVRHDAARREMIRIIQTTTDPTLKAFAELMAWKVFGIQASSVQP